MIIRFDGNGPSYNLEERAVIEDYSWDSYASKMAEIENMGETLTPNVTIANFFNHTSTAQFSAFGIDRETDKPVLTVDGETFGPDGLPKTFNWEDNSNHTFAWTQSLPVLEYVIFSNLPMKVESSYEWLEWQFSMAFPPSTNQIALTQANQTLKITYSNTGRLCVHANVWFELSSQLKVLGSPSGPKVSPSTIRIGLSVSRSIPKAENWADDVWLKKLAMVKFGVSVCPMFSISAIFEA